MLTEKHGLRLIRLGELARIAIVAIVVIVSALVGLFFAYERAQTIGLLVA